MEFESSRIESLAASPPTPHGPLARAAMVAAETVAQSAGDAIGSNRDLRLLEDALRNASQALEGGVGESALATSRLAALLQSLEGVSTPQTQAALKDPSVLATLEHMVGTSQTPAQNPGMPSDLANGLARLADAAGVENTTALAVASAEFAALVNEFGSQNVMQALGALTASGMPSNQNPQAPNFALMAGFLPQGTDTKALPRSVRGADVKNEVDEAPARARRERDVPVDDERGRPYSSEERSRLARLWFDPRRGPAAEARIAVAAWKTFGLELDRDRSGRHDYCDAVGEPWDIIFDRDPVRRERAVSASPAINLILCNEDETMMLRMHDS